MPGHHGDLSHQSSAPVGDDNSLIQCYAIKEKNGKFVPWSYQPRALGEEDVEIKISFCGICGSDIHTAFGGWGQTELPIVVGHEIVGHVAKVGSKVTAFKVGDRVGCGAQCGCCADFSEAKAKKCPGCSTKNENHCKEIIMTYSGVYPDGERAQGGYASDKRLHQRFVFKIPDVISSAEAAPLLCAGVTVFAPLQRYKAGSGKRVAIVGVGGLGHLAVQFANKMGAEVIAFGHSDKKALAVKLGAQDYVSTKDEELMKKNFGTFDLILVTADAKGQKWDDYVKLGKLDAQFVTVAVPEEPLSFGAWSLCSTRVSVTGSAIGSPHEIDDMLAFAAKHNVRPMIELMPMSQVNVGIKKVQDGDVHFRIVLEQGK